MKAQKKPTMAKFGAVHNLPTSPGAPPRVSGRYLSHVSSPSLPIALPLQQCANGNHEHEHDQVRRLSITVGCPRLATAKTKSRPSRNRRQHHWPVRQEKSFQGLSMLSSSQSSMQCHRTRRALHQLQVGRGGMHRIRKQKKKVSLLQCSLFPTP